MAENSKIEWCQHTANLWHGCTKVHAGCDHCYAETLSRRWGREIWGNDAPRMEIKSVWKDLKKFQSAAAVVGEMHRVFVGSMMDIFEKPMPIINHNGEPVMYSYNGVVTTKHLQSGLFELITAGEFPNLLFLFLTKRPSNINKMIPELWKTDPPGNVMFGTSPCDQATADTLIPQLLQVKGNHFLSLEPLLGPIDLEKYLWSDANKGVLITQDCIDWVIVGGESGHGARPMHPDWVRSIRDQCIEAAVPFFFKQWGEFAPGNSKEYYSEQKPLEFVKPNGERSWWAGDSDTTINHSKNYDPVTDHPVERVGKKASGRMLGGKVYDEFPVI